MKKSPKDIMELRISALDEIREDVLKFTVPSEGAIKLAAMQLLQPHRDEKRLLVEKLLRLEQSKEDAFVRVLSTSNYKVRVGEFESQSPSNRLRMAIEDRRSRTNKF